MGNNIYTVTFLITRFRYNNIIKVDSSELLGSSEKVRICFTIIQIQLLPCLVSESKFQSNTG